MPDDAHEDRRHLHRELIDLKDDRTALSNQMKGLLFALRESRLAVGAELPRRLSAARRWNGGRWCARS